MFQLLTVWLDGSSSKIAIEGKKINALQNPKVAVVRQKGRDSHILKKCLSLTTVPIKESKNMYCAISYFTILEIKKTNFSMNSGEISGKFLKSLLLE